MIIVAFVAGYVLGAVIPTKWRQWNKEANQKVRENLCKEFDV